MGETASPQTIRAKTYYIKQRFDKTKEEKPLLYSVATDSIIRIDDRDGST